jgi:hypothetical protein
VSNILEDIFSERPGQPTAEEQANSNAYRFQVWLQNLISELVREDSAKIRSEIQRDTGNILLNIRNMFDYIKRGDHIHFCKDCGRPEMSTYPKLIDMQICSSCEFWEKYADQYEAEKMDGKLLVIGGWVYGDNGNVENTNGYHDKFLGHAGRRFYILTNSGSSFTTNNLWSAGDIPRRFISRMPDNAVFLTKNEYDALWVKP